MSLPVASIVSADAISIRIWVGWEQWEQEPPVLERWTWFIDMPKVEGSTYQSRNAQALELAKVEILRKYPNARFE